MGEQRLNFIFVTFHLRLHSSVIHPDNNTVEQQQDTSELLVQSIRLESGADIPAIDSMGRPGVTIGRFFMYQCTVVVKRTVDLCPS